MHISNRFALHFMQHSNCYSNVIYHSFETLLLLSFFYLMVKSGKSFVKIGSSFQIALFFLFNRNFQPPPPAYLILPNVPTHRLLGPPRLFGTQGYTKCI